jgi:uncharacterized membrane protein YvlD (DUF360 family)
VRAGGVDVGHDVAMIRAIIRLGLSILGNAIGLIVADVVLDGFSLTFSGFIVAVIVFSIAAAILESLLSRAAERRARALRGGTALVSTFLALVVTELVSSGLSISGADTWLWATLIIWLVTMFAGIILPIIFLRNRIEDRR